MFAFKADYRNFIGPFDILYISSQGRTNTTPPYSPHL